MHRIVRSSTVGVVLALCATAAEAQRGVVPRDVAKLAGCYRLTIGEWSGPLPQVMVPGALTPPPAFTLDTAFIDRTPPGLFAAEPEKLSPLARVPAYWYLIGGRNSFELTWTTGADGVKLRLVASGDTLKGIAVTFHKSTFMAGTKDPQATAVAVRTRCGARK